MERTRIELSRVDFLSSQSSAAWSGLEFPLSSWSELAAPSSGASELGALGVSSAELISAQPSVPLFGLDWNFRCPVGANWRLKAAFGADLPRVGGAGRTRIFHARER